jgi:hypothetical protein
MTKTTWNPFMGFGSAPEKNVRKLEQERDQFENAMMTAEAVRLQETRAKLKAEQERDQARAQIADLLAALYKLQPMLSGGAPIIHQKRLDMLDVVQAAIAAAERRQS